MRKIKLEVEVFVSSEISNEQVLKELENKVFNSFLIDGNFEIIDLTTEEKYNKTMRKYENLRSKLIEANALLKDVKASISELKNTQEVIESDIDCFIKESEDLQCN